MKIIRTDIYRFSIPMTAPVNVGGRVLHDREGLLLALTDGEGRCAYGEIAPLPGFDSVTLEQCLRDIPPVRRTLNGAPLDYERFQIADPLLGVIDVPVSSWSAHTLFGVESALMGLYLQCGRKRRPASGGLLMEEPLRIPVNALFIPEAAADRLDMQIRKLKDSGAATVKIKIGRLPAEEEIRQIRRLAGGMGPGIVLRLDGNRNLTPAVYRRYFEALRELPVEYVEEPLPEEEMGRAGDVPWPLALDESLGRVLDQEEPRLSGLAPAVRVIILKPGRLRGLHAFARLVREAEKTGIRTILSSAFNTGVTLAVLGVFSRLAGLRPETAHGLDTLRYLSADILLPSPEISRGKLEIPGRLLFGRASMNENCIREKVR